MQHVWLVTTGSGEDGDEWSVISMHATEEGALKAKDNWESEKPWRRGNVQKWELED